MVPGTSTSEVIRPVSVVRVFIAGGGGVPSSLNGENGIDLPIDLWEIFSRTESPTSEAPPQPGKVYSRLVSRHV